MLGVKILLFCAMVFIGANVIAATYLFFKQKNEAQRITNALEEANKEK